MGDLTRVQNRGRSISAANAVAAMAVAVAVMAIIAMAAVVTMDTGGQDIGTDPAPVVSDNAAKMAVTNPALAATLAGEPAIPDRWAGIIFIVGLAAAHVYLFRAIGWKIGAVVSAATFFVAGNAMVAAIPGTSGSGLFGEIGESVQATFTWSDDNHLWDGDPAGTPPQPSRVER